MNLNFLVTRSIYETSNISQRDIAKKFCISLGKINAVIKDCEKKGLLKDKKVTKKGIEEVKKHKVDKALILACGRGVHLAPLSYDTPKSFIMINGKRMIERQIEQLKSVGIDDITIMVGYLKEKFDYLIDKYDVKLIYNEEYDDKNTLATFYHALDIIKGKNVYICVSDIYIEENTYHTYECEPYYIGRFLSDCSDEWRIIATAKNEIKSVAVGGKDGYCFAGFCFLTKEFLDKLIPMIEKYYHMSHTKSYYWENVLVENFKKLPPIFVYKLREGIITEFDNISDIKNYDKNVNDNAFDITTFASKALKVKSSDIKETDCIKEGTANKSYTFKVKNKKYIARIPEDNIEKFIDRKTECEVYNKLKGKSITEEVIFYDKKNGYMISEYFEKSKTIDVKNADDLKGAVLILKKLHDSKVKVKASCDIINEIHNYIAKMKKENIEVLYDDYEDMHEKEMLIEKNLKKYKRPTTICHGDANPENILLTKNGYRLVDFEYAGMADPFTDIAYFGIYAGFDVKKTIKLLHIYDSKATKKDEEILVSYMALCGFCSMLWTTMRESTSGVTYGSYGMRMYRAFKSALKYLEGV